MDRIRKFASLSSGERRLLIQASLLLVVIKLGLVLLPFETLRRSLSRLTRPRRGARKAGWGSAEKVVWAVEASGSLMPRARTCLTKALAAQVLLRRRSLPARLHIGVVKGDEGQFLAHAWVESEGVVVIGGHELDRYTRLAALEPDLELSRPGPLANEC